METVIRKVKAVIQLLKKTHGQDLVEYALLLALIALGAVAALQTLGKDVNSAFTNIGSKVSTYTNGGGTTGGGTGFTGFFGG